LIRLFSQTLLLLERKKANCFHVGIAVYFEKRAANLIRMQKIAFSTLKSAFRF
jgi:hypothetical protein